MNSLLKRHFRHRRRRHCLKFLFSSPEPVVSWSRGLETRSSLQIKPSGCGDENDGWAKTIRIRLVDSYFFENGEKNLRFKDIQIRVDEVSKLLLFTVPNLSKNSLHSSSLRSPTEASPLFIVGRAREKEKESAWDTMGREKRGLLPPFPSSHLPPPRFLFFDFIVIPSGSPCGGESRNSTNPNRWENRFFFSCWLESPTH